MFTLVLNYKGSALFKNPAVLLLESEELCPQRKVSPTSVENKHNKASDIETGATYFQSSRGLDFRRRIVALLQKFSPFLKS